MIANLAYFFRRETSALSQVIFVRTVFIMTLCLLASGCATDLKREVHSLESEISTSNQRISDSNTWLQRNPDVYYRQQCITPSRGPEPKFSCHTKEESRNIGLAICAMSYKGCEAAVAAYGSKLEGRDEKFLASQACETLVAEMQGKTRNAGDVVVDGAMELVKNQCSEGGWGLLLCPFAVANEIAKFAEFATCIDTKTALCYNNYRNWIDAPQLRKASCESNIRTINQEQANVRYKQQQLKQKKDSFMWKLFGDD